MFHWLMIGLVVSFVGTLILGWCGTFDRREVKILLCVVGGFALAAAVWPLTAAVVLAILLMKGLGLWKTRGPRLWWR